MTTSGAASATAWLKRSGRGGRAAVRLFCFPYAGGSASVFGRWQESFPETVEVCPVELPGRATRLKEAAHRDVWSLNLAMADALLPYLDRPFAFFGHSMGALIGFEFARHLRREHRLTPHHLFVSGRRAPQLPDDRPPTYQLPDEEFLETLFLYNGTQQEVFENYALVKLLLPMMRADFELVQTHVYTPEPPLDCPVTVFGGSLDKAVSREQLEAWREQTSARFSLSILPGDHFLMHTAERQLLDEISRELSALAELLAGD
ncbi:MAG TPA: alpha/beta fold hydrolase [Pyrinomonadaceae bacterium]|nr:alpha/beta fold hydrolase [Pyrinomonadaceae bacterium]